MPVPRPKILTSFTVPTGGWDLQFQISELAQYDHTLTATVPAGTYYMAWDSQSDDFIYQLMLAFNAAITNTPIPNLSPSQYGILVYLNDENRVVIKFAGTGYIGATYENDVKLQWTASDADLAAVLGFDSSADDELTTENRPAFTADYQHAHGWYANADGQLDSLMVEDTNRTVTPQTVSLSGRVTSQHIGERYTNELVLSWLERGQTYSRAVAYAAASVAPYERNVPLECWWRAAREGTEFRVYRYGRNAYDVFVETGSATSAGPSVINDTNKAWGTDPQEFQGMTCNTGMFGGGRGRFLISSNGATSLTPVNTEPSGIGYIATTYYIQDTRYQTYVVDLSQMRLFEPSEIPGVDYYGITIPLLRYET